MSIANYICQNLSDPDPDETTMTHLNKKIKILRKKIKGKLFLQVTYQQQKFGFINGVDNVNWPPFMDSKSWRFER